MFFYFIYYFVFWSWDHTNFNNFFFSCRTNLRSFQSFIFQFKIFNWFWSYVYLNQRLHSVCPAPNKNERKKNHIANHCQWHANKKIQEERKEKNWEEHMKKTKILFTHLIYSRIQFGWWVCVYRSCNVIYWRFLWVS